MTDDVDSRLAVVVYVLRENRSMKEAKHTKVNMVEPYQFEPEYNEDDEWESLNED